MIQETNYPCGECFLIDGRIYRIGKLINQGTDGRIYEAYSADDANFVFAVKYFTCMYNDDMWRSALREIEAAKRLAGCPYTVNVLGYCARRDESYRSEIFILMKRMECCAEINLSAMEILEMCADVCLALEYMRHRKLAHCDVKPSNIFFSSDGTWQLGDFGCVQRVGKPLRSGSAAYRAPEVYRNEKCDARSDLYSLGITAYKLLSGGRFPFCRKSAAQTEYSIINSAIERRMRGEKIPVISDLDAEINEILLKMCEFKPQKRYRSPAQAARRIKQIIYKNQTQG